MKDNAAFSSGLITIPVSSCGAVTAKVISSPKYLVERASCLATEYGSFAEDFAQSSIARLVDVDEVEPVAVDIRRHVACRVTSSSRDSVDRPGRWIDATHQLTVARTSDSGRRPTRNPLLNTEHHWKKEQADEHLKDLRNGRPQSHICLQQGHHHNGDPVARRPYILCSV